MTQKIYLDTSVISALFDQRTPERMAMTRAAWEKFADCNVFLSSTVLDELQSASQPLREKMLDAVSGMHCLRHRPNTTKVWNPTM